MSHGILVQNEVMANKIDSLVRNIKCATTALDNGNIVFLTGGVSATTGEGEVWTASTPTSATPTGAWMVAEPEIVLTGSYKGLDPDVRNFFTAAGIIATANKVKTYDIITVTADNFSNTRGSEGYVGIGASGAKLTWQASATQALYKYIATTTIAISSGAPGSNRVTAYKIEAVTE